MIVITPAFSLLSSLPLSEIHLHLETKFPRTLGAVHFVEYIIRVPSMSTIGSPVCHIDLQIEESALILKFYGAFCAVLYIITTFLSHLRNLMRPDKFLTCFLLFLLKNSFLSPTLWIRFFFYYYKFYLTSLQLLFGLALAVCPIRQTPISSSTGLQHGHDC